LVVGMLARALWNHHAQFDAVGSPHEGKKSSEYETWLASLLQKRWHC